MSTVEITPFDKYDKSGAYHWAECDRRYSNYLRYNPALDARYELTMRAIRDSEARGSLLDVGCGDGCLMARVAPLMNKVVGVDSEAGAIRWAKEKLLNVPNCEPIQTACYDLPFPAESFDIVTSADVIEHLTDPRHHLQEIRRVLRPGGALVLTTPKWRPDRKWDHRHEKEYRAEELSALLAEYFHRVDLTFFWPLRWSRFYATRFGWRLLKLISIQLWNPFLGHSAAEPEKFGQILATCREPRSSSTR